MRINIEGISARICTANLGKINDVIQETFNKRILGGIPGGILKGIPEGIAERNPLEISKEYSGSIVKESLMQSSK